MLALQEVYIDILEGNPFFMQYSGNKLGRRRLSISIELENHFSLAQVREQMRWKGVNKVR